VGWPEANAKKEATWHTMVVADSAELRAKCTRQPAQNARKSARFPSSPEKIVRYIARTAFRSVKTKAVKAGVF